EMRQLSHAEGRGYDRYDRAEPRPAEAALRDRAEPGHPRRARHAGVQGRADGRADQGRGEVRLRQRRQVVPIDIQAFVDAGRGRLPGLLGVEIDEIADGHVRMRLPLRPELLAPNGYLHAGTVVALADSACGYGCIASLPDGATGFTTIELKTNFLATAL